MKTLKNLLRTIPGQFIWIMVYYFVIIIFSININKAMESFLETDEEKGKRLTREASRYTNDGKTDDDKKDDKA